MTWQPITKPAGGTVVPPASIAISSHRVPKLAVSLAIADLPKGWGIGTMLSAALGTGEHFGKLRLARDGLALFILATFGASAGKPKVVLTYLPLPTGVDPVAHVREPVPVEADGDALILSLPKWAIPVGQRAAAAIGSAPRPLPVAKLTDVSGPLMGDPPARAPAQHRQKTRGGGG